MGLIIEELRDRKPKLVYFDESYTGEYPEEAPFTISELRKYIRQQVQSQRRMKHLQREHTKLHLSYRAEIRRAGQSGSTL